MKKFTLVFAVVSGLKIFSQTNESYNLFVSAGVHVGIFSLYGQDEMPYNVQIDKLFPKEGIAFGAGYSYDVYQRKPLDINYVRQNLRIRYYSYLNKENQQFSPYVGGSVGVSFWNGRVQDDYASTVPSFQFLFGMKVKLDDTFFSQTEIGIGSPYMVQTSIGIKF